MSESKVLDELLRKVQAVVDPDSTEKIIKGLTKEGMAEYYKKHPNCFMRIEDVLFPLCGSNSRKCPKMIAFSLKMAQNLVGTDAVNQEALAILMQKLERLKGRYEKEVPTSVSGAVKKAQSTRQFNKKMR